jgi:hypothetical protein
MKIQKIIFMLKKLIRDFNANKSIKLAEDFQSSELSYYYINFGADTSNLNLLIHSFDKECFPLNSAYIDVKDKKLHYYPISIGQYGLSVFHAYKNTKSNVKREHFLRIAEWFYKNRIEDNKLGCYWLTEVDKPEYNVHTAWKSAFSQSRALSILTRAWQITGEEKYLLVCEKALIPFLTPVSKGGVSVNKSADKDNNYCIYEEYVASKPTRVMDGHIFSLLGLYDFIRVTKRTNSTSYQQANALFNKGVQGLIDLLPEYDMGYWVRFNLCDIETYPENDPCTIGYLRLIIKQLDILYSITGREELREYSQRFQKYDSIGNIIKMYFAKFKALKKLQRL